MGDCSVYLFINRGTHLFLWIRGQVDEAEAAADTLRTRYSKRVTCHTSGCHGVVPPCWALARGKGTERRTRSPQHTASGKYIPSTTGLPVQWALGHLTEL